MNLHKDKKLFEQAIRFTADKMKIRSIYVEKDYWVTLALYKIHQNTIGKDVVFKGGTALSKCYKLIERFSEDIDLVVLRNENETDSKLKTKLKAVSLAIEDELPEIEVDGITKKMGMNRKTAHFYNKLFKGDFGQVRDFIVLESSWLGHHEPFSKRKIQSLIGEVLEKDNQIDNVNNFGIQAFEMNVLEPSRTICEKIMSLVKFSYTENPIQDLKNKIRHPYDLHQLLQQPEFIEFVESEDFTKMLLKVAEDDVKSFRNNNEWLSNHPNESLFFKKIDDIWKKELVPTYENDFVNLLYGQLPDENEVLNTIKFLKERMEKIEWNITTK
ncbi:nucleotidyl transferase AbiEii/AbiGii toxin family protein [Epilithonimonas ginsengisoli]|uniref:Nucleotidyl transferase AbiEii/AbiGii toxin family protein n=1 Tax=Epilithonimonas ginsengisoli TaxID=1245592 RepID=A0ABU4JIE1_9FLAO|nr:MULTISPECIES: nucleotidyl transferase AbiEii/AbiGii toxin family protein [Chryseobacterium group]MBV6878840.1 nucleotidyl transferase AbiEii/AbiGii toxin family protein [Epilithonimonas sp. FP105]MDW8549443.1 nucleotidyl transferase AbiEii/AbiGii toxin family protein [Epilithonimonas ginsengisoli]OAH71712.1 hypothetical protein AXA65_11945 [Chryseobacterium sp. FP211-J200]HBV17527.1 nucleotidyl transferase AbiEii/AbiGii toxin family protein [Chryseobacterium carnipullorum]